MVEVLDHAPLADLRQLTALMAVAERASDTTRVGFASREEIGRRIRATPRTATTVLGQLVDAGLLVVVAPGGGRGRATTYRVPRMPGAPENVEAQASRFTGGRDPINVEVQTSTNSPVDNSGNVEAQTSRNAGGNVEAQGFQETAPKRGSLGFLETGPETWKSEPRNVEIQRLNVEAQTSTQPSYNPSDNPHPRERAQATAPSPVAVDDDDRHTPHNQDHPPTGADPLTRAAWSALSEASPRPVTLDHAAAVAHQILNGRTVRDPAAYIRRAITDDPERFTPPAAAPSDRSLDEAIAHARGTGRTFDPGRGARHAAAARAALQGGTADA